MQVEWLYASHTRSSWKSRLDECRRRTQRETRQIIGLVCGQNWSRATSGRLLCSRKSLQLLRAQSYVGPPCLRLSCGDLCLITMQSLGRLSAGLSNVDNRSRLLLCLLRMPWAPCKRTYPLLNSTHQQQPVLILLSEVLVFERRIAGTSINYNELVQSTMEIALKALKRVNYTDLEAGITVLVFYCIMQC